MADILKGAPVAAAISEKLIRRVEQLKAKGITPTLALLRIGERPDDVAYETSAVKRCEKIGIAVRRFVLDGRQNELPDTIRCINADNTIHGCLLFRPLPNQNDEETACKLLSAEKDVDGMTAGSLASVFTGRGAGYSPCTAQACMELLDYYGIPLAGKRVAVIGRSLVIGRPVAMLIQNRDATVTMCHSKTENMPAVCRDADIIIAAAGKAGLINEQFVTSGQVILDVGINIDANGALCGDVAFDSVSGIVKAITPVPGGIGAITTAVLAKHIVEAAEKSCSSD